MRHLHQTFTFTADITVHLQTFPGRHQGFHLKNTMLLNIRVPLIQAVCPMALSLTRLSMVRLQASAWLNKEGLV